jgi:hypothetical protein
VTHVLTDLNAADQATVNEALAAYTACATGSQLFGLAGGGPNLIKQTVVFTALDACGVTGEPLSPTPFGDSFSGVVMPLQSAWVPSGNLSTLQTNLTAALVAYFAGLENLS